MRLRPLALAFAFAVATLAGEQKADSEKNTTTVDTPFVDQPTWIPYKDSSGRWRVSGPAAVSGATTPETSCDDNGAGQTSAQPVKELSADCTESPDGTLCGTLDGPCAVQICFQGSCLNAFFENGTPCGPVNQCEQNLCVEGSCSHLMSDGGGCFTGNQCVIDETCSGGVCGGGTDISGPCSTGNQCVIDETCSGGVCGNGTDLTGPCSTGNQCIVDETCSDGTCQGGTPVTCTPTDACHTIGSCDSESGCPSETPIDCDDGLACTTDTCDPETGCVHTPYGTCNHYLFWNTPDPGNESRVCAIRLTLQDRFHTETRVRVKKSFAIGNPAVKVYLGDTTGMADPTTHFMNYVVEEKLFSPPGLIPTSDQFANLNLKLKNSRHILVPAGKTLEPAAAPKTIPDVPHYRCYNALASAANNPDVINSRGSFITQKIVTLTDEFDQPGDYSLIKPLRLCVPVIKTHDGVTYGTQADLDDTSNNLVCYVAEPASTPAHSEVTGVQTLDQFTASNLTAENTFVLCAPATLGGVP